MREVSSRAARIVLEVLEAARLPLAPLVAGLPVSLADLRAPSARIEWDVFAQFLGQVDALYAEALPLEDIGARALTVPSFEMLRRAGQLLMDPKRLYDLAGRFVAPALFPHVVVKQTWLPSGRLVVTGELLPGYRESVPFFRLCHGNVAALPRVLDLPPSRIEEQVLSGRSGRLVLLPPPSHTLLARIRRSVGAVGALGDVWRGIELHQTELEKSLAAFRTSRHQLQQLIERLPDGVLIRREEIVCWANAAMLEILGLDRIEDVVGRPVLSLVPLADRESLALAMRRTAASEVSDARTEYRLQRPDGSIRRVQSGAAQIVEFEGERARMVVLRDVTEQHRLREQAAISDRLASLGALAANIAHEINNPLAYVRLSLETASREAAALGSERPLLHESLARAEEGTDRVLEIVRDLKMLSRMEEAPDTAIDLVEVLRATVAVAERSIRAKARLVATYRPTPLARGMRGKLGQVFLNLLTNAVDAIPEGDPENHVIRVATDTDAAGRIVVEIGDTGSGISPEIAARVFDPFFTTKPVGLGTGLGLAMCHRIVTEHGGQVTFESTPGATTFRVTLPRADTPRPVVSARDGDERGSSERARRRVLVVDDEPAMLTSLCRLLASVHDVETAPSGRAGLEILAADASFDAVVTDLMMADLTGMDLYEQAREVHPDLERRFLFMTGGTFTPRAQHFVAKMAARCLEKPFERRELLDAVDAIAFGAGGSSGVG